MTDWYVDPFGGSDSNNGSNFALRCKTIAHLSTVTGADRVKLRESGPPLATGVNFTWTDGNRDIALSAPLTKTINVLYSGSSFTPVGSGVTCASDGSTFRTTSGPSQQFSCANTLGASSLIGFMTLTGVTNFSAFQQLTLWLRSNGGGSDLQVALCSDTSGATPVNTFNLVSPAFVTGLGDTGWIPITVDSGGALGSSIHSIALYGSVTITAGPWVIHLDSPAAAKAPGAGCLTLNDLVTKNTGTETAYAVRDITDTHIYLDMNPTMTPGSVNPKYAGVTETIPGYCINTLASVGQSITRSGSAGSPILLSGGWDSTTMSSQSSVTWLDGLTAIAATSAGLSVSGNYIEVEKIGATRFNEGHQVSGSHFTGTIEGCNNNSDTGLYFSGASFVGPLSIKGGACNNYGVYSTDQQNYILDDMLNVNGNEVQPINMVGPRFIRSSGTWEVKRNASGANINAGGFLGALVADSNAASGFDFGNERVLEIASLTSTNNTGYAAELKGNSPVKIYESNTSGNSSDVAYHLNQSTVNEIEHFIKNATYSETKLCDGFTNFYNQRVKTENENGTSLDNHIYTDGGSIDLDSSDPYTLGGLDETIPVTSANRDINYPIIYKLPPVAVKSSGLVTITCQVNKSHATNISADLVLRGGRIAGVPSDVVVSAGASVGYQLLTLTFTPSEIGVIQPVLNVYSTNGTLTEFVRIAAITRDQA